MPRDDLFNVNIVLITDEDAAREQNAQRAVTTQFTARATRILVDGDELESRTCAR
jgi:hypothetical protein